MPFKTDREYRALAAPLSVQAATKRIDTEYYVEGYATTFDKPYLLYEFEDGTKFYERIDAHALDGADMSDVIMQYDHEGRVFARNRNNTLSLMVDSAGLKITAELGGTDIGRQLYQEIKGGYTDKMSFAFAVAEDKRETLRDHETGKVTVVRTITKIKKLYDVSAVSIPANGMTSISARRFADGVIGQIKAERLKRAKTALNIKLKLMGA